MDTKDRILSSAMRLFQEKGYGSTSVADILKDASVHSGSLYHAFPTKQDVLIAVLRAYRDGIHPMLLAPAWKGVDDPVERVFSLLNVYRQFLIDTEFTFGCPIGSLALELHEPDPPVRELLAGNFEGWIDHVQDCLSKAAHRFPISTDTRRLATFILTVMEGGVMQSRTYRTVAAFDQNVDTLRDYLNRLEAAHQEDKK